MAAINRQVGGDHYLNQGVQPWKAMEDWLSADEFAGYLRGNAIKYLARAGAKGDMVEDLRKAEHYLERLLELLAEKEKDGGVWNGD